MSDRRAAEPGPGPGPRRWSRAGWATPVAIGLDVFFVVLFAAIGRRNHHEAGDVDGVLRTAAPFMIALGVAWITPVMNARPWSWPAGLTAAAVTVTGGMLLRRFVFDRGTALSFVIVATLFITAALLGWRLVAGWLDRRR